MPTRLRIEEADSAAMSAVLARSHEVWGGGLSLADYTRFHLALKDSDWGRAHSHFLIGRDDSGAFLSSLNLYDLRGRLDGRPLRIAGLGAIFSPLEHRNQGLAEALVEEVLARAAGDGYALAMLVSETGARSYEERDFVALPATEAACLTRMPAPWPKEPGWVAASAEQHGGDPVKAVPGLRAGRPEDIDALVEIHAASTAAQRFAFERDRGAWDYALMKSALAHQLKRDGEERLLVIEEEGRVAAYAFIKEMPESLRWREHGVRPGREARLIDLFWCAMAQARRSGKKRLEGWYPPPATGKGGAYYPIARRRRDSPVVMACTIEPAFVLPRFTDEDDCRVFELDSF